MCKSHIAKNKAFTKEDLELLEVTFWAFAMLKSSQELQRFFKKMNVKLTKKGDSLDAVLKA